MELALHIEQLQLKSEYLHTNPKQTHFHEENNNSLFISWNDCVTVLYSLDQLVEASLWNPVEPVILQISIPVLSILTFNSKVYCIDKIGSIYHLKQVQRDSPDLFDNTFIPNSQHSLFNYKWMSFYSQKCPCNVFSATSYSDGIAIIAALSDSIIIQLLKINFNKNDEPTIFNTCSKQIKLQKEFPFLVTSFISCIWRNWFSSQQAIKLFEPNILDSLDIFVLATEESKLYYTTSDTLCRNAKLFLYSPPNIIHIQFSDFESKKLLLVSSSGILTVMHCVENVPLSFIYLAITKVITTFIIDSTVIVSDGIHLFQITLNKQFSKIVKQVITPLKGVVALHRFQLNNIIAITHQNKVYTLSPKYEKVPQELRFKFDEKIILNDIKNLYKSLELLTNQHDNMKKYINAVSIIARKDLVAQNCSINVLIYSGTKAIKLGAHQNEYIFAIKLSIDCAWLTFPSTIWKLLVRITNNENSSSNCGLYPVNVNLFNNSHPLIVKHNLLDTVAQTCTSGLVYCELICQIQNDLVNNCLVIPLKPIKLNSLYFINVEKREKIPVMNHLEDRHKYIFEFPEHLSLLECLTIITNKNKHRISKSLYTNTIENMPKVLPLNFFGKIVSVILDDKVTKTIVLECIDKNALIRVRDGIFSELSNDQPATIKHSVLSDVQKQLCLLEELSMTDKQDKNLQKIKTRIQNQISTHIPV